MEWLIGYIIERKYKSQTKVCFPNPISDDTDMPFFDPKNIMKNNCEASVILKRKIRSILND